MAFSFVQRSTPSPNTSGSAAAVLPSTPTSGNVLVISIAADKNAGEFYALTDWTLVHYVSGLSCSAAQYFRISDGTNDTYYPTWENTSQRGTVTVEEYAGFVGTPTLGVFSNAYQGTSSDSISTGTTAATTNASALAVAVWGADSGTWGATFTASNVFTATKVWDESGGAAPLGTAYKELTTTQTIETTFTATDKVDQMAAGVFAIYDIAVSGNVCNVAAESAASEFTATATIENAATAVATSAASEFTVNAVIENSATVTAESAASEFTANATVENPASVSLESAASDFTASALVQNQAIVSSESAASEWIATADNLATNVCNVAIVSAASEWSATADNVAGNICIVAAESAASEWLSTAEIENAATVVIESAASDWTAPTESNNAASASFESAASDFTASATVQNAAIVAAESAGATWSANGTIINIALVVAESAASDWTITTATADTYPPDLRLYADDTTLILYAEDKDLTLIG